MIDLRRPPIAAWRGEVVLVAGPDTGELRALLDLARERRVDQLRVAEAGAPGGRVWGAEPTRGLADAALRGAAVLAVVRLSPGAPARRLLAAWRLRIAQRVPCRCVWLVGGRVYPE